jgi:hypothetical protein
MCIEQSQSPVTTSLSNMRLLQPQTRAGPPLKQNLALVFGKLEMISQIAALTKNEACFALLLRLCLVVRPRNEGAATSQSDSSLRPIQRDFGKQ